MTLKSGYYEKRLGFNRSIEMPIKNTENLEKDVEDALNKLRENWKAYDDKKFEYLVRKVTVTELLKIEERKQVQKEAAELKEKLRQQREADEDARADMTFGGSTALGKTGGGFGSPKKGVGFFDQSQTSSPTKFGSPSRKAMTGADSEADTRSVMTGGTSPMKGGMGGSMNFGGGGIQAIL